MSDIVFIDSGTGGIPYLLHLLEIFPKADCVYVGDTVNFPYGEKLHEDIVKCVLDLCKKIIQKFSPKVVVIACNTMSVNALDVLREVFPDVKFVGTVPAIKVAGDISKKRCIGLLATNSTVNHPYNQDLKNHFASDCKLVLRGDPQLISFIEHNSFTASKQEKRNACKSAVDFFKKEGCDVIILGCTHFLNIAKEIQEVCGNEIKVVDSREGVVNRALSLLYGGVTGVSPVGRGSEQRSASEGKANEPARFPSLFITGFNNKKDENEYNVICKKFNLNFGGVLN